MIINRYIAKKFIYIFFPLTFFFIFIISMNFFVKFLLKVSAGVLSFDFLIFICISYIPEIFVNIIPISLCISIIILFNVLKRENKLIILFSFGYTVKNFVKILIFISICVSFITFLINVFIIPYSIDKRNKYFFENDFYKFVNIIIPNKFNIFKNSSLIIYLKKEINYKKNFFLFYNINSNEINKIISVFVSNDLFIKFLKSKNIFVITFYNGNILSGNFFFHNFYAFFFDEYNNEFINLDKFNFINYKFNSICSYIFSNNIFNIININFKISFSIFIIVQSFIFISLFCCVDYKKKFLNLIFSIMLFLTYYCLLLFVQHNVDMNIKFLFLKIFFVHFFYLFIGCMIFLNRIRCFL